MYYTQSAIYIIIIYTTTYSYLQYSATISKNEPVPDVSRFQIFALPVWQTTILSEHLFYCRLEIFSMKAARTFDMAHFVRWHLLILIVLVRTLLFFWCPVVFKTPTRRHNSPYEYLIFYRYSYCYRPCAEFELLQLAFHLLSRYSWREHVREGEGEACVLCAVQELDMRFVKVHAPFEVLRTYANSLRMRMPLSKVRPTAPNSTALHSTFHASLLRRRPAQYYRVVLSTRSARLRASLHLHFHSSSLPSHTYMSQANSCV